jgi:uncharacterized protein HemY
MSQDENIEKLRQWWQAAPAEERLAIRITAAAVKVNDERDRDIVQRRIEAHWKRYVKKDYSK